MAAGRKRSTVGGYESIVNTRFVPFFGQRTLDRIERHQVEALRRLWRETDSSTTPASTSSTF